MNGFALVLVTATLGVDYGWQPSSDGRLEYIIQIEPVTLIALREGQEVLSQIDPYVRNVRRFRIRVGSDLVPRVGSPPRDGGYGSTPRSELPPQAGVTYGWQPFEANSLEFIVQISPERLVLLKNGEDIVGEIPAEVQQAGRFRVRSASGQLPRQWLNNAAPQPSGVTLASANQPPPSDQPAAPSPETPRFTAASPTTQGSGATQLGSASGTADAMRQSGAFQPSSGPTVNSPPRLGVSQDGALSSPTTGPRITGAAGFSSNANQGQPPGSGQTVYGSSIPTIGTEQSDSRFIYGQTRNQAGPTPNALTTRGTSSGSNGGWQQPAVQPVGQPAYSGGQPQVQSIQPQPPTVANNAAGWSSSGGNAQDWPPRLRENPTVPPASNPGGWGTRPPASNPVGYATGQYASGTPSPSHDYLAPTGGPAYTPNTPPSYTASGQSPGYASAPPDASGGSFSPHAGPAFQASQGHSSYTGPPAMSRPRGRDAGSDLDWPLNTVSFGVTNEKKANPLDFWNSLDETANDPTLAYLYGSGTPQAEEAWWPLTLAMLALFASMGGNLYIGWIAVDVYRKYLDAATDEYDEDDYQQPRRSREEQDGDDEQEGAWGDRRRRRERTPVGGDYN